MSNTDLRGTYSEATLSMIRWEEGFRLTAYLCSEGYPTIGYGYKLSNVKSLDGFEGLVWTREMAQEFLVCKLDKILSELDSSSANGGTFRAMSEPRKRVVLSMCYQMGVTGVFKFKNFWAHSATSEYGKAADEMLNSRWARQTPARAKRHAEAFRTNQDYKYG